MTDDPGAGSSRPTGKERPPSPLARLRHWFRRRPRPGADEDSVRETVAELIEEREEEAETPIHPGERTLIANVLKLRDRTVREVMVPRADIVSVEADASFADLVRLIGSANHSRLPVYRDTLDDILGLVHIKDVVDRLGEREPFRLDRIVRPVEFVAPTMRVLDLLLHMRARRTHLALVVDEYGGVDGLVTIEDLVEEIVGEIEDEHDRVESPHLVALADGTFEADARASVRELEERIGAGPLAAEEGGVDTLGGLVFTLAGRVPARGELIPHPAGLEFEVLEADPRRVKRLRVRHVAVVRPRGE